MAARKEGDERREIKRRRSRGEAVTESGRGRRELGMLEGGDGRARQAARQLDTTQIFWAYSAGFNEAVKMKNDPVRSNNLTSKEETFFSFFFMRHRGGKRVMRWWVRRWVRKHWILPWRRRYKKHSIGFALSADRHSSGKGFARHPQPLSLRLMICCFLFFW